MKKNKDKLPLGLKVIIGFIFLIFLGIIITIPFKGIILSKIIMGVFSLILLFIVIGLSERENIARIGAIIFFILGIITQVFVIIRMSSNIIIIILIIFSVISIRHLSRPEIKKIFLK